MWIAFILYYVPAKQILAIQVFSHPGQFFLSEKEKSKKMRNGLFSAIPLKALKTADDDLPMDKKNIWKIKEKEESGFSCGYGEAIHDDCYRCIRNSLCWQQAYLSLLSSAMCLLPCCRHSYDSMAFSARAVIILWTLAAVMFISFIACCRLNSCSAIYPCHLLFMFPLLSPIIR